MDDLMPLFFLSTLEIPLFEQEFPIKSTATTTKRGNRDMCMSLSSESSLHSDKALDKRSSYINVMQTCNVDKMYLKGQMFHFFAVLMGLWLSEVGLYIQIGTFPREESRNKGKLSLPFNKLKSPQITLASPSKGFYDRALSSCVSYYFPILYPHCYSHMGPFTANVHLCPLSPFMKCPFSLLGGRTLPSRKRVSLVSQPLSVLTSATPRC